MARLQILELPEGSGDDRPPFILVVDQVTDDETERVIASQEAFDGVASKSGARAVAVFHGMTVDIPANDTSAYVSAALGEQPEVQWRLGHAEKRSEELCAESRRRGKVKLEYAERIRQLEGELEEARQWARHGYEIGQRHCGWSDHGVAPDWLTEGWSRAFDSCEHLKQAAEYDTALSRVLQVAEDLEALEAHGGAWDANQQAAQCIRAAVGRPRGEETTKP